MCEISTARGKTGTMIIIIGLLILGFLGIVALLAFIVAVPDALLLFIALHESFMLLVLLVIGIGLLSAGIVQKINQHSDCARM